MTGDKVNTPLGRGTVQWETDHHYVARITLTDENRAHLSESITPHAHISALWEFPKDSESSHNAL